jgi:hypothetical protein
MSIDIITKQINEFLKNDTSEAPKVMAIIGDWGTGKTYTWNKLLENWSKSSTDVGNWVEKIRKLLTTWRKSSTEMKDQYNFKKYSYVSLFGINSLETFKWSIFKNTRDMKIIDAKNTFKTDITKENSIALIGASIRKSVETIKSIPMIKNITPSSVESLLFLSVTNILICIDDFERKGDKLTIKEIMGLISLLKEQKNCKIVLIFNDGEEGLEDYKKYREKVVDIELKFSLKSTEAVDIVFNEENNPHKELVKRFAIQLGIVNIRVLRKIHYFIGLTIPFINETHEPEILEQVIHSLVLFSWCHYCSNDGAPPLDFVLKIDEGKLERVIEQKYKTNKDEGDKDEEEKKKNEKEKKKNKKEKKKNEKEKNWRMQLANYGYYSTYGYYPTDNNLNCTLADMVCAGYIIEDKIKQSINEKDQQLKAEKGNNSFNKTFEEIYHSFKTTKNDVINTLYSNFESNIKHITINQLQHLVALLDDLNEKDKLSEAIDFFTEQRKEENIEIFNPENLSSFIHSEIIISKFDEFYKSMVVNETAEQVLERIANENGWNEKDELILENTTVEEYLKLFKSISYEKLPRYIRRCLSFGQYRDATDRQKEIASKATEALKEIAKESEFNKIKVRRYGVTVD